MSATNLSNLRIEYKIKKQLSYLELILLPTGLSVYYGNIDNGIMKDIFELFSLILICCHIAGCYFYLLGTRSQE